ncbi:hypothetical protein BDN72DRAFT_864129 [Pluteus cervinus]|uniref:Uncharacterized protein n=1 Tax=Pluteus cervinus TaxID=181527 RepID=A0ACD3A606_9AGAR|nr:hypothetical protein BDN72DRAFT_864129 [Pluteus cervinus]
MPVQEARVNNHTSRNLQLLLDACWFHGKAVEPDRAGTPLLDLGGVYRQVRSSDGIAFWAAVETKYSDKCVRGECENYPVWRIEVPKWYRAPKAPTDLDTKPEEYVYGVDVCEDCNTECAGSVDGYPIATAVFNGGRYKIPIVERQSKIRIVIAVFCLQNSDRKMYCSMTSNLPETA